MRSDFFLKGNQTMDKDTKVALVVALVTFLTTRDTSATLVAGGTALAAGMFL